eukprot:CAMPEP_0171195358 /NCGR_PEP_ID=MMETSP0790-20130122/21357_1 /TAXON_ID=2925 /ORGANISM="Alexandrium catenella, Strain OF101" /LENGTH=239 /DNA_ID=CAMNT_0011660571 /DNA_START=104 /DNA_END=823 /DNA_ORIENTATION=+
MARPTMQPLPVAAGADIPSCSFASVAPSAARTGQAHRQPMSDSSKVGVQWPEQSFIFEPAWEPVALPQMFVMIPNAIETCSSLREAQRLLQGRETLEDIDGFNMWFMERLLALHTEIEKLRGIRQQPVARATAAQPLGWRLDLAAVGAFSAWSKQRPAGARRWELTPHFCEVVQARRAEHHGLPWLQVTTRLTAEERWVTKGGAPETRIREHYVVFEMPRGPGGQDFRIAEIRPDIAMA